MSDPVIVSGNKQDIIASYWVTAHKSKEKIKNPTEAFKDYCKENPWALECREYET
jgi:hypothetical protein